MTADSETAIPPRTKKSGGRKAKAGGRLTIALRGLTKARSPVEPVATHS